jgi:hypothetical protein
MRKAAHGMEESIVKWRTAGYEDAVVGEVCRDQLENIEVCVNRTGSFDDRAC